MSEVKANVIKLSNEKSIKLEAVNGKTLYVDTSSVAFLDIQMDENDDHVKSISIEDKYVFNIGDKYSVSVGTLESVYEIVYMVVAKKSKSILLFSSLPNKTSRFLLPVLRKSKDQLMYETYFVNAYIDNEGKHISLKYRFTGTESYKLFEQTLIINPLFIKHEDCDNYHVMYTFRIPEEFELDVFNFKEGRYSLFSKALRQRILKFYGGEDSAATMQVIRLDEELKKKLEEHLMMKLPEGTELASKPELINEIYNIQYGRWTKKHSRG